MKKLIGMISMLLLMGCVFQSSDTMENMVYHCPSMIVSIDNDNRLNFAYENTDKEMSKSGGGMAYESIGDDIFKVGFPEDVSITKQNKNTKFYVKQLKDELHMEDTSVDLNKFKEETYKASIVCKQK